MSGWRFSAPAALLAALCAAGCDASSQAPAETVPTPMDTVAPSVPAEGDPQGESAELVWRSSPGTTFAWPLDVAVAEDGRVFVRDVSTDSIVTLDAEGYITGGWGKLGTGDGEFDFHDDKSNHVKSQGGLVVLDDTVFVADKHRVQLFDLEGNYLDSWSSRGREPGQILKPSHMAVGFDGNIYVLDTELAVVQVFTPEGELVSRWPLGVKDFNHMSAICANPEGDVFVAEEEWPTTKGVNVRIYKYSPGGDLIKTWRRPNDGDDKSEAGEFGGGTAGMACGPDGRVYIGDEGADRVQVFSSEGKYLFSFTGPPGSAPNGAVALGTDGIFVTDSSSGSVSKFHLNR